MIDFKSDQEIWTYFTVLLIQLTANGDPTANGQTVLKIVEVEKKHEPEMRLHQHQTEGKNVSVIPRKQKLATKRIVLQVSLLLLYDHIQNVYIKTLMSKR